MTGLGSVVCLCVAMVILQEEVSTQQVRRRHRVCSRPMSVGPCRAAIRRYYFDRRSGQCLSFSWGGCQSNGNNFETKTDCIRRCGCNLRRQPGNCMAYFPRWYYVNGRCRRFIYGGCGANANNFPTRNSCRRTCVRRRGECQYMRDGRCFDEPTVRGTFVNDVRAGPTWNAGTFGDDFGAGSSWGSPNPTIVV